VSSGVIDEDAITIACSHQDRVIASPAGAMTILHSTFMPHAGILYGNGAAVGSAASRIHCGLCSCLLRKSQP